MHRETRPSLPAALLLCCAVVSSAACTDQSDSGSRSDAVITTPAIETRAILAGTKLLVTSMMGKPVGEVTDDPYVVLRTPSRWDGFDGCRELGGEYTHEGDTFTFISESAMDMRLCEPVDFKPLLGRPLTVTVSGPAVELKNPDGTPAVSFMQD